MEGYSSNEIYRKMGLKEIMHTLACKVQIHNYLFLLIKMTAISSSLVI